MSALNAAATALQPISADRRMSQAPPASDAAAATSVSGVKPTSSAPAVNATIKSWPVMPPASAGRYPSAAGTPNPPEIRSRAAGERRQCAR